MKNHEIEAWVYRIIKAVKNGVHKEDSRVELKSDWLSPEKAARRIAAHANSAGSDEVLWLIGVDEKKGVVGVEYNDLAEWFDKVKTLFDGVYPAMIDLNFDIEEKTIVALLFDTTRKPYLVKNITKGTPLLEVPWREGTSTRSANRGELFSILSPAVKKPKFEILKNSFSIIKDEKFLENKHYNYDNRKEYNFVFELNFYVTAEIGSTLIIPIHKIESELILPNKEVITPLDFNSGLQSYISHNFTEIIINGPGPLRCQMKGQFKEDISMEELKNEQVKYKIEFIYLDQEYKERFEDALVYRSERNDSFSKYFDWCK